MGEWGWTLVIVSPHKHPPSGFLGAVPRCCRLQRAYGSVLCLSQIDVGYIDRSSFPDSMPHIPSINPSLQQSVHRFLFLKPALDVPRQQRATPVPLPAPKPRRSTGPLRPRQGLDFWDVICVYTSERILQIPSLSCQPPPSFLQYCVMSKGSNIIRNILSCDSTTCGSFLYSVSALSSVLTRERALLCLCVSWTSPRVCCGFCTSTELLNCPFPFRLSI